MNIRKVKRRRADGTLGLSSKYHIDFRDHRERLRCLAAYGDKSSRPSKENV